MNKSRRLQQILRLIDDSSQADSLAVLRYLRQRLPLHPLEQGWGITAETILSAIARSSDLTLRGIRGIIAEAVFEEHVIPALSGWRSVPFQSDQPYDFLLEHAAAPVSRVHVQVKLQRTERHAPKLASRKLRGALKYSGDRLFIVEVQKTRTGKSKGEDTRPYRFGDFDILGVNMHPSTGDWNRFMYTVGNWLLPRPRDANLIEIMQPVPDQPDGNWTDDVLRCIEWHLSGASRRLYQD